MPFPSSSARLEPGGPGRRRPSATRAHPEAPDRRRFLAAIASLALPAAAQQDPGLPRIGFLANSVPLRDLVARVPSHPAAILIENGLRDLGWVDGKTVQIVWRSAEGDERRLPALAEELVALRVDLIVAFGPGVIEAAKKTRSIPIVMGAIGFMPEAARLASPDRNVTGLTLASGAALDGKRIALLKEAMPAIKRVGFLDMVPPGAELDFRPEARDAAARLGVSTFGVPVDRPEAFASAIAQAVERRADALVVADFPLAHWAEHQRAIHQAARRHRLPVIHSVPGAADSGGLFAYGPDILANYRRTPYFIDRILRGARPSDLPIEQPTRYLLIINRAAARAIDLELPSTLLLQADRLID
jgi:putative ABC transport system substrate-binding protein